MPSGIQVITLTATFQSALGAPLSGGLRIAPTSAVEDTAGEVILGAQDILVPLDASGHVSVVLPCTDSAGTMPPGWGYNIAEDIPGLGRSYQILLPSTLGPAADLSTLAPAGPIPPVSTGALPLAGGTVYGPLILAADPASPLGAATKRYVDSHGGDKTFTQDFASAAVVSVPHGLGKRPAVTVIDTAGDEVIGDVAHTDVNNLTVSFSAPFSGTVLCN
jgi:hypothetical protein